MEDAAKHASHPAVLMSMLLTASVPWAVSRRGCATSLGTDDVSCVLRLTAAGLDICLLTLLAAFATWKGKERSSNVIVPE